MESPEILSAYHFWMGFKPILNIVFVFVFVFVFVSVFGFVFYFVFVPRSSYLPPQSAWDFVGRELEQTLIYLLRIKRKDFVSGNLKQHIWRFSLNSEICHQD